MGDDEPELIDHLGLDLWQCAQAWTREFVDAMRARGYEDFSLARAGVLPWLARDGTSRASDVVAASGLTKQAVNQTLDELERAGLIERQPDPDDRRAKRIAFTARGRAFIRDGNEAKRDIEARWLAKLPAAEARVLAKALKRLASGG